MDVGQPKDFLSGTCLYLSSLTKKNSKLLTSPSKPFVYGGNVLIDPSARIGKNCRIGPNVTIGPNVVVGDGVRLQRSVLLANSKVKDHAWVKSTIVGWNSSIGKWARMENVSVLGDDVTIGDEVYVNGGSILPHKTIKVNVDGMSTIPLLALFWRERHYQVMWLGRIRLTSVCSADRHNVKGGKVFRVTTHVPSPPPKKAVRSVEMYACNIIVLVSVNGCQRYCIVQPGPLHQASSNIWFFCYSTPAWAAGREVVK